MFAHSVSPLKKEWLKEISPELSEKISVIRKGEAAVKKRKDTTNYVTIDGEPFRLERRKGKKKKFAIIEYNKAAEILKRSSFEKLHIPAGVTGTLIHNNIELLSGEKLSNIFRVIPYINPESLKSKKAIPRGNINSSTGSDKIIQNLHIVLSLSPLSRQKSKSRQFGFVSLNSDSRGNYWFKSLKSFDNALAITLSSLEDFMDEFPENSSNEEKIEKINKVYRQLNNILEEQDQL
jgi:hypothetical protein